MTERAAPLLPLPTHVLRQTNEGTIMIGDSHEDTGYSTASTSPVMAQMAAYAVRCFPALAKLRVVRSWGRSGCSARTVSRSTSSPLRRPVPSPSIVIPA